MTTLLAALLFYPPPTTQDVFTGDTRLNAPISIRVDAESLTSVCKKLAKGGVPLEVSPAISKDVIILSAKERPLKEVLITIADHFGWQWVKEGGGYRILQSDDSKKNEQRLLQEAVMKPYLDAQAQCRKSIEDSTKIDRVALKKKIADLDQRIVKLSETAMPTGDDYQENPELMRLYEERAKLYSQIEPFNSFSIRVFAALPPAKLAELEKRSRIVLSYHPTPSQSPLSGPGSKAAENLVAELITQAREASVNASTAPDDGEDIGDSYPVFKPDDVVSVRVAFSGGSREMMNFGSGIRARIAVLGRKGQILTQGDNYVGSGDNMYLQRYGLNPDTQQAAPKREAKGKLDEPLTLTTELKEDLKPATNGMPAFFKVFAPFLTVGSEIDPLVPEAKVMNDVAEAAGISLIADAYDAHLMQLGMKPPKGKTAAEIIYSLTDSTGAKWSFDGSWAKIRTSDWLVARAETAPRDILLVTRDRFIKQSGLTLDQSAELAAKVTDRQANSPALMMAAGMAWAMGGDEGRAGIYGLRFWHSLSIMEKTTLLKGGALTYFAMAPDSKANLSEFLYRTGDSTGSSSIGGFYGMGGPAEEIAAIAFPPTDEQSSPDTEITQLLPTGPTDVTRVTLKYSEQEAVALMLGFGEMQMPVTLPPEAFAEMHLYSEAWGEGGPQFKVDKVKPALIQNYAFTFFGNPAAIRTFTAGAGIADPAAKFAPPEKLPPALWAKIQEAEKKAKEQRQKAGEEGQPPPEK